MCYRRMTPEELREFDGYQNISDEKAELIIDDAMALARLCLEMGNNEL